MNQSLFSLWRDRRQSRAPGGLRLAREKPGLPSNGRLHVLPLPSQLVLPLLDYRYKPVTPCVQVGEPVALGQALAEGVVASAKGRIRVIEPRPVIHASGLSAPCVVIETDAADDGEHTASFPEIPQISDVRLAQAGIRGLGGAAFPTAEKFTAARHAHGTIDTLLINAVECEPKISCDEALILCEAPAIVQAINSLVTATGCRRCVLAIENDKIAAIELLRHELQSQALDLELLVLDPVYPAGAERTLIRRLTGKRLAPNERPADRGILSLNVATALAIEQARQGFAMISRVVTLCADEPALACNVRVRFGTPVADVLRLCGIAQTKADQRVRANGPLSGFDLLSLQSPVVASTNSLIVQAHTTPPSVAPCIRCGDCETVCPEQLLPQQLHWCARQDDISGLQRFALDNCITCGCCDRVCPSRIPLTAEFRHAKSVLESHRQQQVLAEHSLQRFNAREERLQGRRRAREQQRRDAEARLHDSQGPIADALARARQRRRSRSGRAGAIAGSRTVNTTPRSQPALKADTTTPRDRQPPDSST